MSRHGWIPIARFIWHPPCSIVSSGHSPNSLLLNYNGSPEQISILCLGLNIVDVIRYEVGNDKKESVDMIITTETATVVLCDAQLGE